MRQERLEIAHLMHDFFDLQLFIAVPEDDLVKVSGAAFLASLASIATVQTWAIFGMIFAAYVLLVGMTRTFSVSSIWSSAFKLFAVSIGQGVTIRNLTI